MEKLLKLEFGFGLGLDRHERVIPTWKAEKALETIQSTSTSFFGGGTLVRTEGEWRDGNRVYREHGATLIAYWLAKDGEPENLIRMLADVIKTELDQAAVYFVKSEVTGGLI